MANVETNANPQNEVSSKRAMTIGWFVAAVIGALLILVPPILWDVKTESILVSAINDRTEELISVMESLPEDPPDWLAILKPELEMERDADIAKFAAFALRTSTANIAEGGSIVSAANYQVYHWLGLLLLAIGAAVLVGISVPLDAVAAGTARLASFEMPIRLGGTALLLPALLFVFGFASERFGLGNPEVLTEQMTNLEVALNTANKDKDDLNGRVTALQAQMAAVEARSEAYSHILTSELGDDSGGIELLRLRLDCGEEGGMQWIDWALPDVDRNDVVESLGPDQSVRQGSDVQALTFDRGGNLEFVVRTARRDPVMTTTLEFYKDSFILATIRPRDASLQEYCSTLDEHTSDALLTDGTADVRSTALELSNE